MDIERTATAQGCAPDKLLKIAGDEQGVIDNSDRDEVRSGAG
jgi:hypothetical protein